MIKKLMATLFTMGFILGFMTVAARADYCTEKLYLRQGIYGNEVTNLQNDLKKLGYFNAKSTGYYGTITKQSVSRYQANNALKADGITGPRTSGKIKVHNILKSAKSYFGVPYVWGGATPQGFDCSGFTKYVFAENRISIPRTSLLQNSAGQAVSTANLSEGDIVVFTTISSGPSHVGIYSGGGKFVHASSGAGKIIEANLYSTYWAPRFLGARRMF